MNEGQGTPSEEELKGWELRFQTAWNVLTKFDKTLFEEILDKADQEDERTVRQRLKEKSYKESFGDRLQLLVNYAERNKLPDKVEHVFATILNGIKSGLEADRALREAESTGKSFPPRLAEQLKKSRLSKEEAKSLVIQAMRFIGGQPWSGSWTEMMRIWDKESEWRSLEDKVLWTGGGQLLSSLLGEEGKSWDPFVLFDKR